MVFVRNVSLGVLIETVCAAMTHSIIYSFISYVYFLICWLVITNVRSTSTISYFRLQSLQRLFPNTWYDCRQINPSNNLITMIYTYFLTFFKHISQKVFYSGHKVIYYNIYGHRLEKNNYKSWFWWFLPNFFPNLVLIHPLDSSHQSRDSYNPMRAKAIMYSLPGVYSHPTTTFSTAADATSSG